MPPYHRLAKSLSPSFKSVPFLRQRCSSFDRIGAVLPVKTARLYGRLYDALNGSAGNRQKASTPHPNIFDDTLFNPLDFITKQNNSSVMEKGFSAPKLEEQKRKKQSAFLKKALRLKIGALWKQYRSERARVVEEYTAAIAILALQENVWPSPPDPKVPSTSAAWEHNYVPISPDYAATLMKSSGGKALDPCPCNPILLVNLSWIRPPHDGGAPIDGYVIEQRKVGDGDWTRANIGVPGAKTVRDTRCTVKGLPEKKQFEFRVRAVNEAGEGVLSMTSDLVFTTDQPGRPVFDLSNLKDTTVRAGETTTITLPCSSGGLKPNVDVLNDDSSDQPSSSTARRREPRKQKSARKDAIELTPLDIQCCSKNLTLPRPKNTERTASGSGRRRVGSTAADRPAQAASAACAAGEEAPDDRDKVPGEPPVTVDGKTKYGAENESREKPRLAKRTKQSAPAGQSLRVRGQTSGEPVVLNFDRTRAELELVAPASNCCINVLTPVRPSQRGKYGRSRANTANAGAASTSTATARTTKLRVLAINEAGPSAPSAPSAAQICKARSLKPQIITAQRKWKVRAGRTLSLCIKFVGTSDPSVCWVKAGGAGTLPPELIMEEHIKGNTSIFFPAAKRSESGAYELRLKNNIGETEGHFEVLVQDRPAPPKGSLAVDNVARDSCTLSWQPPEDDGGSEVTNYVVECRDVGSQVWLPVNNVVGTNSTVPNLQEGHEYQFRVCAVNAFGCSDPLNTDSDVLAMDPYDPPGRPEVTHHDNNQISIKWAPSTDTGGSPIAHYDVQRKDAKTRRWIKVNTHPVYDCAYTDERVQPEHGYYYRVVAVNEAGLDKLSDQSELAWAKPKFEAPRFELDDINGKEVRVRAGHANTRQYIPKSAWSGSGQCRIVATNEKGTAETRGLISVVDRPGPPEGPITYPATTKQRDWERVPAENVTLPNYTVRNLEKGAQYQFRVFAENMVGISEPLNGEPVTAKDPFGPPGPPSTPEVTAYDSNSVSLKWNLPREEGGSPVTGYVIERFEKRSGGDWASVKGLGILPLTSCTVPGLAQGESYQFRVRAVNAVGKGPPSGACVECSPFVSPPGAPEKPRVGKVTKHTVNLSWICPLHDGGASIDGYVIEQRKMGDDDWTRANIGVPGAKAVRDTRCTVKDLPEKEQFEFRVRAVNKAGEGEPSNLVFTTDQPGRPVFDMSNLKDTTAPPAFTAGGIQDQQLRVGQTINYEVAISGKPLPAVTWEVNGKPLIENSDGRVKMDTKKGQTVLEIEDAKRSDSGKFTIKLNNKSGECASTANVKVVGPPEQPKGSLDVGNISGEGVKLKWKPADEDELSPTLGFVIEMQEGPRGQWKKIGETEIAEFQVNNLKAHEQYKFRVKAFNEIGDSEPLISDLDALLLLCDQTDVISWKTLGKLSPFNKWSKIGEGAFGEVFKAKLKNAPIALKVIPFAVNEEQCSKIVNGYPLKPAKFILNEMAITKELSKLSTDTGNGFVTPSFVQLHMKKIVKGFFPQKLLDAWDAFKAAARSEDAQNERPDIYADEGLHFVIIGLSYGGKNLEAYTIRNGLECYSIFHQLALSLAIAESVLEFEHRDLHAGNILVEQCPADEKIRYQYRGEQIDVVSNGVRASIIDFSISRLKTKGVVVFADLSNETDLFEGKGISRKDGDYQFDVYRMMKAAVSENWDKFWPQTNVLWMGYAAKKLFYNRYIRAKRKEAIEELFSNFEKNFATIHDLLVHPDFSSVFAEFTSGN
ncbi:hypothetical protein niasHT_006030 [Heterodera trifolii]|uniref:Non-specific serine/threonine protein kinase n=2 Tax=Heterodera trifolii TaxID=157864 RepID=A0ABD2M748_9BILA